MVNRFPRTLVPSKRSNTATPPPNQKESENLGEILAKIRVLYTLSSSSCIRRKGQLLRPLGRREFLRPLLPQLRPMISKSQCCKIKAAGNIPFLETWVLLYTLSHLDLTTALLDIIVTSNL